MTATDAPASDIRSPGVGGLFTRLCPRGPFPHNLLMLLPWRPSGFSPLLRFEQMIHMHETIEC